MNAFEDVEAAMLDHRAVSFEGEELQQRLARRRRNWIADVAFEAA